MKRCTIVRLLAVCALVAAIACERNDFSTNPGFRLSFSADTVVFDTVFTTIGSATRSIKIYNRNSEDIEIQSIKLAGGSSSSYRINVDGVQGPSVSNVAIRAKDSLYLFVEVTVDPTLRNSPVFVPDSVVFSTNGNVQDVKLVAWGQDVHLHRSKVITADTVLTADKPHLIYDYILGLPNVKITIEPGAKLYFHNNAVLWVAGTLVAEGTPENIIVFEGDRLEQFYNNKAGQWYGIKLNAGSKNSSFKWAQIKNSIIGIQVDTCVTPTTPTLLLEHTRIENTSYAGLLANGATVEANNCLFSNSAYSCVSLMLGGSYRFYHCTVANYWGEYMHRKATALLLNNYYVADDGSLQPRDLVEASFYNCIVYGSLSNELTVDNIYSSQQVNAQMNYLFSSCILRTNQDTTNTTYFIGTSVHNPKFKDVTNFNFELDTLSPAKDAANVEIATLFSIDLNSYNRLTDTKPDIGAFERVEQKL